MDYDNILFYLANIFHRVTHHLTSRNDLVSLTVTGIYKVHRYSHNFLGEILSFFTYLSGRVYSSRSWGLWEAHSWAICNLTENPFKAMSLGCMWLGKLMLAYLNITFQVLPQSFPIIVAKRYKCSLLCVEFCHFSISCCFKCEISSTAKKLINFPKYCQVLCYMLHFVIFLQRDSFFVHNS